jgi:hypothetical protein
MHNNKQTHKAMVKQAGNALNLFQDKYFIYFDLAVRRNAVNNRSGALNILNFLTKIYDVY